MHVRGARLPSRPRALGADDKPQGARGCFFPDLAVRVDVLLACGPFIRLLRGKPVQKESRPEGRGRAFSIRDEAPAEDILARPEFVDQRFPGLRALQRSARLFAPSRE